MVLEKSLKMGAIFCTNPVYKWHHNNVSDIALLFQSNPVNMDTERSVESVHINEVFLLY